MSKQLSLFNALSDLVSQDGVEWRLYVDGASRSNPGLAGGGFYIMKNDNPIAKKGYFLGHKTNNEAEYYALLLGLDYLMHHTDFQSKVDRVSIFADSLLLVRHLSGHYRVKSCHLMPLYTLALSLLKNIKYSMIHVLRENNAIADEAANHGIDTRSHPLVSFINLCKRHGITL